MTNIKHSLNLGNVCLGRGQVDQAFTHYNAAVTEAFASQKVFKKWFQPAWPERCYIVNSKYKFVYCPIPKVATTSLNCIMYLLSDDSAKDDELSQFVLSSQQGKAEGINESVHHLHRYVHENLTLQNSNRWQANRFINSADYFKFTVVRSPWQRLTSAYLNKFVDVDKPSELMLSARTAIEGVYSLKNQSADYQKSITFRQFLNYIVETDDQYLDVHWRPQHTFFRNIDLDFIGKLENLSSDFAYIRERLNIGEDMTLPQKNVTTYKNVSNLVDDCSDLYPSELKKLSSRPIAQFFYTPDLIDLVKSRYKSDFEQLGYGDLPKS